MKNIILCLICLFIFLGCNKDEIKNLQNEIKTLQAENKKLKETDQYCYQKGIELLNNKQFIEAKNKFEELIDKYPVSNLINNAKEKISYLNEHRKKADLALKSVNKNLSKYANALDKEKYLNDFIKEYNYPDIKEKISEYKEQIQADIDREQEIKKVLNELGIEISDIVTYWKKGGYGYYPSIQFSLKNNRSDSITRLHISASFELTEKKEALGEGNPWGLASAENPLKPGYSKQIFFSCDNGYEDFYSLPPATNADLTIVVNGKKRVIRQIVINRKIIGY